MTMQKFVGAWVPILKSGQVPAFGYASKEAALGSGLGFSDDPVVDAVFVHNNDQLCSAAKVPQKQE